jgi:hypothetical protein
MMTLKQVRSKKAKGKGDRPSLASIFAFLLLTFAFSNGEAQVGLQVEPGLDGVVRIGRWASVAVTGTNNGAPVAGRLEVSLPGARTVLPLELPTAANKRTATLLVPQWEYATLGPRFKGPTVAVLREGRREIARAEGQARIVTDQERVLAVCAGEGGGLRFLSGRSIGQAGWALPLNEQAQGSVSPLVTAHLEPAQMPATWAGYGPADLLVLRDTTWQRLEPEQRRAVRQWVEMGNRLLVCGEDPAGFGDPEGRRLLPVIPSHRQPRAALTAFPLPDRVSIRAPAGQVATVAARPRQGATVALSEGDSPIVVSGPRGFGLVLWVGFDPFRVAPASLEGRSALWAFLINRATGVATSAPAFPRLAETSALASLQQLPRFPAPSRWTLASFGLVYAVLFGPVNVWLLRRLKRTVRAWLLMPALSLAMTGAVLALGNAWGNAQIVFHTTSVLETMAGSGTAREENLAALFSPTNSSFQLEIEDPAPRLQPLAEDGSPDVARETGGVAGGPASYPGYGGFGSPPPVPTPVLLQPDFRDGDIARWDRLTMTLYTFQLFQTERAVDLGGEVLVDLDDRLDGRVLNRTPHPLRDVYLRFKSWRCSLGELGPGATKSVASGAWQRRRQVEGEGAATDPYGRPGTQPSAYPGGGPDSTPAVDPRAGELYTVAGSLLRPGANRTEVVLVAHARGLMLPLRFTGISPSPAPGLGSDSLLIVRQPISSNAAPAQK